MIHKEEHMLKLQYICVFKNIEENVLYYSQ